MVFVAPGEAWGRAGQGLAGRRDASAKVPEALADASRAVDDGGRGVGKVERGVHDGSRAERGY